MDTNTIREALRNDILALGVPSATLGAFEDIIRQECAGRAINEDSIRAAILNKGARMKDLFIQCACHGEGLKLEYYKESSNEEVGYLDELWISLWQLGFGNGKPSMRRRIQLAFHILKEGTLHTDMVILNKENITELKEWLNKIE